MSYFSQEDMLTVVV